jgi:tRNA(fMet)-specific endonuclease VapC
LSSLLYLLDTNILSELVKHPQGSVSNKIAGLSADQREGLFTSVIVACELRYGVEKRRSEILARRVEDLLKVIEVLPLPVEADRHYGRVRADLEAKGTIIGANDMLIAAHALACESILITDNLREFRRVPGLNVENWLTASE